MLLLPCSMTFLLAWTERAFGARAKLKLSPQSCQVIPIQGNQESFLQGLLSIFQPTTVKLSEFLTKFAYLTFLFRKCDHVLMQYDLKKIPVQSSEARL